MRRNADKKLTLSWRIGLPHRESEKPFENLLMKESTAAAGVPPVKSR
jgi:hypothetical protein